ncbi:hypothetical protein LLH06_06945 [Mucilaginibacter daejeonensis]|uniref:tetratricopeptide repeat protein n=1 Tax=Mucilaginibacter daejeonensis TaxID=398049 RepID=UPI001D17A62C|nr:hypothetical protein [Mucilaginibacter daejeonensis]UEG54697.1 hypothetical protein LLH06_06945 [Mucilaginibacter daejeonensis]
MIISTVESSAQNAYVKLGYQAMMDKDFKTAVRQLEKACMVDSNSTNALWMLGYSYFHSGNFKRSVGAYTRVINIDKTNREAYYFRAIARLNMAKDQLLAGNDREKCMLGAINDLNKAILIKPEDSYFQNRGLAYKEYAALKMKAAGSYDKTAVASALKAAIADFEKLLSSNPSRTDIASLLDVSKEKLATVVGHH